MSSSYSGDDARGLYLPEVDGRDCSASYAFDEGTISLSTWAKGCGCRLDIEEERDVRAGGCDATLTDDDEEVTDTGGWICVARVGEP